MVSIDEMYGATRDLKDPRSFHVHVLVAVTDKKREQRSLSFTCGTAEQAGTWIDVLQHTIIGMPLTGLRLRCCFMWLVAHLLETRSNIKFTTHSQVISFHMQIRCRRGACWCC